jgi:hypothetical protein
MNHPDPMRDGIGAATDGHRFAVDLDPPGVGRVEAV